MKLSELQKKDIIDINSGVKVGNIIDVIINESGLISSLIVDRNTFALNFLMTRGEIEVSFNDIVKI